MKKIETRDEMVQFLLGEITKIVNDVTETDSHKKAAFDKLVKKADRWCRKNGEQIDIKADAIPFELNGERKYDDNWFDVFVLEDQVFYLDHFLRWEHDHEMTAGAKRTTDPKEALLYTIDDLLDWWLKTQNNEFSDKAERMVSRWNHEHPDDEIYMSELYTEDDEFDGFAVEGDSWRIHTED